MGVKPWGWDQQPADPFPRSSGDEDRRCATRRIVESTCKTEEVEPGKFIRRCEKTEKILKDCIGRPTEVVEYKTEHTEDDVTGEMTTGLVPFGSLGAEPFTFPGIQDGFEAMERGIQSDFESIERGFARFLDAADKIANGFFDSFGIPSRGGVTESSPFVRGRPEERQLEGDPSETHKSPYTEYASEIRDV